MYIYIWTSRLLDQLGPEGRIGENVLIFCLLLSVSVVRGIARICSYLLPSATIRQSNYWPTNQCSTSPREYTLLYSSHTGVPLFSENICSSRASSPHRQKLIKSSKYMLFSSLQTITRFFLTHTCFSLSHKQMLPNYQQTRDSLIPKNKCSYYPKNHNIAFYPLNKIPIPILLTNKFPTFQKLYLFFMKKANSYFLHTKKNVFFIAS